MKIRKLAKTWFSKLGHDRIAMVCLAIIGVYVGVALLTAMGWVATPWDRVVGGNYQAPSLAAPSLWFGTDIFGRSVFYKMIHGAQVALSIGFLSALISIPLGVTLGALAGYLGGWVDDVIVWFYTTFSSIPSILLLIAIAFVLGKGMTTVYIAIGITSWVGLCRVIRGEFMKHKEREYVLAAQSLGASTFSRIFKHILPNVFHQVIISFALQFQYAIKSEVVLSYLGLGAQGRPSWGLMIDDAKLVIGRGLWWELTAATLGMFFLLLALNVFSDSLRDALDPKLSTTFK